MNKQCTNPWCKVNDFNAKVILRKPNEKHLVDHEVPDLYCYASPNILNLMRSKHTS